MVGTVRVEAALLDRGQGGGRADGLSTVGRDRNAHSDIVARTSLLLLWLSHIFLFSYNQYETSLWMNIYLGGTSVCLTSCPSFSLRKESLVALEGADEGGGVLVLDVELLRAAQHFGDRVGYRVEEQLDGDVDEEEEGEEQEHAHLES